MGILFLNVRDIHFYERKLGRDLKIIEKESKEKEFKDLWIVTPANSFAFGSSFLIFKVGTGENRNCSQDSGSKILETTLIRRLWIQDSRTYDGKDLVFERENQLLIYEIPNILGVHEKKEKRI